MRICMSACSGLQAWVQAAEEGEEVRGEGVREEVINRGIFARWGVAAGAIAGAAAGAGGWGRARALFGRGGGPGGFSGFVDRRGG